jgi:hypothetical protein
MASPEGLDRRWSKSEVGETKEGAEYALSFGPGYDWRAKVTRYLPGSTFELQMTEAHQDWMDTRVGFQLEPESQGVTRVRFYLHGMAGA